MAKGRSAPWRSPDGLAQLKAWRQEGLTQRSIAKKAGIGLSTLKLWMQQYPEIREALRQTEAKDPVSEAIRSAAPAAQVSIEVVPGGADLYSLARDAGLLPLSPDTDPKQLERLVESALLRRALGYRYATITSELRKDPVTGENIMVVTKRIDKDVPPDTSAQLFWLKCHAPERWRDKPGDEPEGDGEVIVTFDVDEEDHIDGDDLWEEE